MTPAEAAEKADVSRRTIYRLIKSGQLEATRIGKRGRYRVRDESVERLLAPAGA